METLMKPKSLIRRDNFKTYDGTAIPDLSTYVTQWLADNTEYNVSIHVGCDSQVNAQIKYVTCLAFLRKGKGGHMITREDFGLKGLTINDRLMNEVILSVETAESLKHLGLEITIHVDYNPNPMYLSNEMFAAGIGTGTWYGYKTVGKPVAWCASYSANKTTRVKRSGRSKKKKRGGKVRA